MKDGLFPNLPANARWPLRFFLGATLALGVGLAVLEQGARPWLLGGFLATGTLLAYTLWDETKGRAARLNALRRRWLDAGAMEGDTTAFTPARPTGLRRDDLHFMEDGQPLIVRLSLHGRDATPTVAVLTPLPETTTAFKITAKHLPPPTFDGLEAAGRGPSLEVLPGVATLVGSVFGVTGNDPARITRFLDDDLRHALREADVLYRDSFRGLTFDGRFLAVHFVGEAIAEAPTRVLLLVQDHRGYLHLSELLSRAWTEGSQSSDSTPAMAPARSGRPRASRPPAALKASGAMLTPASPTMAMGVRMRQSTQ